MPETEQDTMTVARLEDFGRAWDRHDVESIMSLFAEECTFITGWGARFEGRDQVREGVRQFFERFPDGRFSDATHFVCGNRGVSEWMFTATTPDGKRLRMTGCDVFTFKDGKITVKNAFRKEAP